MTAHYVLLDARQDQNTVEVPAAQPERAVQMQAALEKLITDGAQHARRATKERRRGEAQFGEGEEAEVMPDQHGLTSNGLFAFIRAFNRIDFFRRRRPTHQLRLNKMRDRPSFKRVIAFMTAFECLTLPVGVWGWMSGLPFWAVMPGALLCGLTGGGFLSVAVYAIQTGYMQRSSTVYRFSERPGLFIMDSIMVTAAIALSVGWPIGYSLQELPKIQSVKVSVP